MVHLKDKFAWGVLPATCWSEIMGAYAAQVACAVTGDYGRFTAYREILAPTLAKKSNGAFVDLVGRAVALGFKDKWKTKGGKNHHLK
jgi:hypothetical protein